MRGLFGHSKNSGNRERQSAASLSPPTSALSPSNFPPTVPNPSVRPNQGSRLIAAPAGHPPPPGRHHSVSSISQGSTVQLIGPANAAEGLGIGYGITTEDTAAYRPQSAEPTGIPPPSSSNIQQGQSSSRRPLAANNNNSYRGPSQQQPPPQQGPQQLQGQNNNNNTSNNGAPPQGTSQIASLTGSISRRISLRSPRGSPHQPQGQFPHNSSETSEVPDPYNQSTGPSRPQSMHPTTPVLIEEESHQYTVQRAATDVDSQYLQTLPPLQQVDSLGQIIQQPPQGFQQQQQQQYYQGQQQQQMPQPRRSMEIQNNPLQHPQITQLQQNMQAPYQPGSPLPPPTPGQQAYQQTYDPSKFSNEPLGRMTPPLTSGQQQQQHSQSQQPGGPPPPSSLSQPGTARTGNLDIAKLCDDYDNLRMKPHLLLHYPAFDGPPLLLSAFFI